MLIELVVYKCQASLEYDIGDGIIKVPQGPYGPLWAHMGPYGAHMGPYTRKFPKIPRKFLGIPRDLCGDLCGDLFGQHIYVWAHGRRIITYPCFGPYT